MVPGCITPVVVECRAEDRESATVAVGHAPPREEEDALSEVRSADVGRSKTAPFRIEPSRGQVGAYDGEPSPGKVAWPPRHAPVVGSSDRTGNPGDVFDPQERCAGVVEHAADVGPQPPLVVGAHALPGRGSWLAGEPRHDEIHRSSVVGSGELPHVAQPDRRRSHVAAVHRRRQTGDAERFPFHHADAVSIEAQVSKSGGDSALEPSDA